MPPMVTSLSTEQDFSIFSDDIKPITKKLGEFKHQNYFSYSLAIPAMMPEQFDRSFDYILENSKLKLRGSFIDNYKRHYLLVLLNLARSLLCKQWLLIPMNSRDYRPGSAPHRNGYNLRNMKDILDTLYDDELIYRKKGKKYKNKPSYTAIQPTEIFGTDICLMALETSSDFTGDYAFVNKQSSDYIPSQIDLKQLDQDQTDMNIINSFLESHSWPMKGPMRRIYSGKVGLYGRIYCDFQAIPKRTIRIRPTSLIDEIPIAEVDIKSSHPRLAAQIFEDIKLSRDFYREVCEDTDVFLSKVKDYFRVALSCDTRESALGAFKKFEQINTTYDFDTLEDWMANNLPNIPLYIGWSGKAMNLEGEMVKYIMLKGIDEGKVVLPIHDAIAVKIEDAEWGKHAMHEAWLKLMGEDYCEVDIDYPDSTEVLGTIDL